jgi:GWxTD domain-containing protein
MAQDEFGAERPLFPGAKEKPMFDDQILMEAVNTPSDSAGYARVDVFVRVACDFPVFMRTRIANPDSLFSASFDASIDVLDAADVKRGPVASSVDVAVVYASDVSEDALHDRSVLLTRSFYLPRGGYKIAVELNDRQASVRKHAEAPVGARVFDAAKSVALGSVIPVQQRPGNGGLSWSPLEFGNSVLYAQKAWLAVSLSKAVAGPWNVELRRRSMNGGTRTVAEWRDVQGTLLQDISGPAEAGQVEKFSFSKRPGSAGALAVIELPMDTVDAGMYELVVRLAADSGADSLKQPLQVLWRDMPTSLRDVPLAVSVMRYILTEKEHDAMSDGPVDEQESKLKAYWRSHDPTPGTIVNERMNEYFRRTDQAFTKFATMTRRNGALTDRGKIYILYGEPERTERVLSSDGAPEEVWEYPSLHKTFHFVDRDRKGNYRLK